MQHAQTLSQSAGADNALANVGVDSVAAAATAKRIVD